MFSLCYVCAVTLGPQWPRLHAPVLPLVLGTSQLFPVGLSPRLEPAATSPLQPSCDTRSSERNSSEVFLCVSVRLAKLHSSPGSPCTRALPRGPRAWPDGGVAAGLWVGAAWARRRSALAAKKPPGTPRNLSVAPAGLGSLGAGEWLRGKGRAIALPSSGSPRSAAGPVHRDHAACGSET